ncbi:MAG: isoprenylcysteine carboxylmethyltransferase family protein [Gammaproteobacteria bacterium]|nr:isoprenylcysteine carboxylmethyltransferase family protein [Gammaproteobacteria bacterium]MDE0507030.1 isoprenylcysteine carboxylmethyltransferase family protein [Gammaproteobacteria bacterium]MXX07256.1 isoprenylcysteine carboxylmethyltransferase family protein [Gammaproteobacteria bacterium]MYA35933.1 isoprenylcysteine carboxylmethyltransferase family protein [Gammaproteobacteria bacterium]MYE29381.1 isoprenylcysteine carboxylmethyltransferase family protein [Gammaproteobacteria bacterium]
MNNAPHRPKRIVIPPIWFALGLIAVFLLDRYLPLVSFSGPTALGLGAILILLGLASAISAAGLFRKADTGIVPFSEATALVTSGAFRFSRNPMYLGMVLVLLGAALATGSAVGLLVAPVFMLIIQYRFILDEERMMREVFGKEFEDYRRRVRRWI